MYLRSVSCVIAKASVPTDQEKEMTRMPVELNDDQVNALHKQARAKGMSPQALLQELVSSALSSTKAPDFEEAARRVLEKNAELYERLS